MTRMDAMSQIAEARIRDAMTRGEFDDLPGKGLPLELEDLSRVPDELRAGYILLRSQGYAPEQLELRKECLRLHDLLAACRDGTASERLRTDLRRAQLRLELLGRRRADSAALTEYREGIAARLGGGSPQP